MTTRQGSSLRLLWLLPAAIALLFGLNAGLLLLGVPAPVNHNRFPEVHGMLLALGFVGTLIALERATAWGGWPGFLAPAVLGLGGVLLVLPVVPLIAAKLALVVGMTAFTLLYVPLWRRQYDAAVLTQLLGAGLALIGAILWLGQDTLHRVVPWLIGFLVLTICAERVELARITMGPSSGARLLGHAWVITAALVVGLVAPQPGSILLGLAIVALLAWLIVHDVARKTIRAVGATRYIAACILAGYGWLTVGAVVLLFGNPVGGAGYDAVIHAVFLGFTFSMIMGHATTILPAVLKVSLPYRPALWVPAGLLQLAMLTRLWLGDGLGMHWGWQVGGVLGVAALLVFAGTAVTSSVLGPPTKAVAT